MLAAPPARPRAVDAGTVYPVGGTTTRPSDTSDGYGDRTFSAHAPPNDLHVGYDQPAAEGTPVTSPVHGALIRAHYSHLGFETDGQLARMTEVDAGGFATFTRVAPSALRVAGSNGGLETFLASAHYRMDELMRCDDDDIIVEGVLLGALAGLSSDVRAGVAFLDAGAGEYAVLHHEADLGGNVSRWTWEVTDSGGTTTGTADVARGAEAWLRVRYDQSAGVVLFSHSVDGDTFTALNGAGTAVTWTSPARQVRVPLIVWRPGTSGSDGSIDFDSLGAVHPDTIGRFGNWVEVAQAGRRWLLFHLREITASLTSRGALLQPGQLIGAIGQTGFDDKSGRILTPHVHIETILDNAYPYDNDLPVNPMTPAAGFLPRANVSSNVAVVRTLENDPNGDLSHKLAITVTREDDDLDLSRFTFVGSGATRILDWDARTSIDPADRDNPDFNDIYREPVAFNAASATYQLALYFQQSVVGNFVSWEIRDGAGNVLASECDRLETRDPC